MGDPVAVLGLGRTSPTVLFDGDPGFFYPGQAVFRIRYALGKGGLAVQLRISPKALLLWRIYLTAALDVYKRQLPWCLIHFQIGSMPDIGRSGYK